MSTESDERKRAMANLPMNLYLQAFLAEVQSRETLEWLNKDFGYSNLNEEQIAIIERIFRTFNNSNHNLRLLHRYETGADISDEDIIGTYSCLKALFSRAAAKAVLFQSHKGWARELAHTQKFVAKRSFPKKKWLGLKKEEDDDYE